MKKINILLPTILIASSVPMVSVVGCGKKKDYDYEVDVNLIDEEETGTSILFSNITSLQANKTYKFNFATNLVDDNFFTSAKIFAFISYSPYHVVIPNIDSIRVVCGGVDLQQTDNPDRLSDANYLIYNALDVPWGICTYAPSRKNNVFNIYITFTKELDNVMAVLDGD